MMGGMVIEERWRGMVLKGQWGRMVIEGQWGGGKDGD